jgi:hypothetical protein
LTACGRPVSQPSGCATAASTAWPDWGGSRSASSLSSYGLRAT